MDATRAPERPRARSWLLASHTIVLLVTSAVIPSVILYHIEHDYQTTLAFWKSRLSTAAGFRSWTLRVSLQQSQDDLRLLADLGATRELLSSPENRNARGQLSEHFHSYKDILEYSAIYLLDGGAQVLFADTNAPVWDDVIRRHSTLETFRSVRSGGHYSVEVIGSPTSDLALLFMMPVFASGRDASSRDELRSAIGVVAIVSPVSHELAPLLVAQTEPTDTGETLLLQLEESGSRYISSRRFTTREQGGVSWTDSLLRSSRSAAENRVSFGRFKDYRGVEVFAGMQKIPGIRCVVVNKIDCQEALSGFYHTGRLQIMVGGAMLLLCNGLILLRKRTATAREIKQELTHQERQNQLLETKVAQRTNELTGTNERLRQEMNERQRVEEQIRTLNANLEERVRDRTARLEAVNAEMEAFSYSVSHDLRAPLRAVNLYATILWEDFASQLPEKALQPVRNIQKEITRMAELIDGLLDLSRLGRQELCKRLLDPADLVREAWCELQTEHAGRNVQLVLGDLPCCEADPFLLRQVFVNLLSNALKYTNKKRTARIEVGSENSAYYVRDDGVGFDMCHCDRLFGVFQRLHRAEDFEGIGIGLANVRQIVQRHGGRVWAEGAINEGATFFFTLASTRRGFESEALQKTAQS